jgi:predicted MFS family arabinose efflux permease
MARQLEHAMAMVVPPDRLLGLEGFFESTIASHPTIERIELQIAGVDHVASRSGQLQQRQDIAIPVQGPEGLAGTLHLGVNPTRLERTATDSKWDIAIVLLVALLATVEVLVVVTEHMIGVPLRLAQTLTGRVASGDWTVRAQPLGLDAAGRFLSRLNALVRRMNERRRHVDWIAEEVAREVPGSRDAVRDTLTRLSGIRFAREALQSLPLPRSPAVARGPLFLFLFAEQLSTSFIPIYAKAVRGSDAWVPAALAAGLPITIFAGTIAIASPFGASLVGRLGVRLVLALGCLPAMAGYGIAAGADSIEAFALGRAVSAVGYALITISCQAYLVAAADEPSAAGRGAGRNMAVFVMAAMTGAVCGTAIGAVLADRIGYRGTFIASAFLTAAAGLLAWRTMDRAAGRRAARAAGEPTGSFRTAMQTPRFMGLLVFAAVPAKLVLSGFVFYICPLFLLAMDNTQPEIGRQVMLYALTMLLTIRAGAWAADRLGAATTSIAFAGAATGAGLLLALVLPGGIAIPLAIAVTGLSQGLASAPMLAVVPETCPVLAERMGLPTLYGYVRSGERMGSIAGPLLAAALVAAFGFVTATATIGLISVAATAAYWLLARRHEVAA